MLLLCSVCCKRYLYFLRPFYFLLFFPSFGKNYICRKTTTMAFEIAGKLIAVYNTVQRSETFKTREFIIENSEEGNGRVFTSYIKFQCTQDRTSMPDKHKIGDMVKVHFNIRGTKWSKDGKDNYITNLDAWRIEPAQSASGNQYAGQPANDDTSFSDGENDLPF